MFMTCLTEGNVFNQRGNAMSRYFYLLLAVTLSVLFFAPPAAAKRVKKNKVKNKAKTAEQLIVSAEEAYGAGDLETALISSWQAVELDPDNARALRVRGRAMFDGGVLLQSQGNPEAGEMMLQGLADLERALELDPGAPESGAIRQLLMVRYGASLFPDPGADCPPAASKIPIPE